MYPTGKPIIISSEVGVDTDSHTQTLTYLHTYVVTAN